MDSLRLPESYTIIYQSGTSDPELVKEAKRREAKIPVDIDLTEAGSLDVAQNHALPRTLEEVRDVIGKVSGERGRKLFNLDELKIIASHLFISTSKKGKKELAAEIRKKVEQHFESA